MILCIYGLRELQPLPEQRELVSVPKLLQQLIFELQVNKVPDIWLGKWLNNNSPLKGRETLVYVAIALADTVGILLLGIHLISQQD